MGTEDLKDQVSAEEEKTALRNHDLDSEPDLPQEYGRTTLVLMARDPWWGYAYWEITEETRRAVEATLTERELEDSRFVLRVLDRTSNQTLEQCPSFDIAVPEDFLVASWYINFPDPARVYSLALGRLTTDGALHVMALSNSVEVPAASYSENIDHSWEIRNDEFQRILNQEMARIREIRTQQFRNARDLNVERDRQFQTRILRVPGGEAMSSADLVSPGVGITSALDSLGGSSEALTPGSSEQVMPGSSELLAAPGSSELAVGISLAPSIAPGSSEQLVPGSSELLLRPGSSELAPLMPELPLPELPRPLFPGASEQLPLGSSEQVLILRPVVAAALPREIPLAPGSSEMVIPSAQAPGAITAPGSSENLIAPGASEIPLITGQAPVVPGSSEMVISAIPGVSSETLAPGASETAVPLRPLQQPIPVLIPGSSENLIAPGASEIPLMPGLIIAPGASEQLPQAPRPVQAMVPIQLPGSSEMVISAIPGVSSESLIPGSSENLLFPGASEGLLLPGASENLLAPGSSESLTSRGSGPGAPPAGSVNEGESEVFFQESSAQNSDLNLELTLFGEAGPGSTVNIAGEDVVAGADGRFSVRIALPPSGEVDISVSFDGGETFQRRILSLRTPEPGEGR